MKLSLRITCCLLTNATIVPWARRAYPSCEIFSVAEHVLSQLGL